MDDSVVAAAPIVRSSVAPLQFESRVHYFHRAPEQLEFDFQADVEINVSVRHVRERRLRTARCVDRFDMCLFYYEAAAVSRISSLLLTPPQFRLSIARQIVQKGEELATSFQRSRCNSGWIRLIVDIEVSMFVLPPVAAMLAERDMVERALALSAREAGNGMVPADKEAVRRSLKRVRLETDDDASDHKRSRTACSICLEDIETCGASMPCDHVFHDACIVEWLSRSHYCPLCRFPIPTG